MIRENRVRLRHPCLISSVDHLEAKHLSFHNKALKSRKESTVMELLSKISKTETVTSLVGMSMELVHKLKRGILIQFSKDSTQPYSAFRRLKCKNSTSIAKSFSTEYLRVIHNTGIAVQQSEATQEFQYLLKSNHFGFNLISERNISMKEDRLHWNMSASPSWQSMYPIAVTA